MGKFEDALAATPLWNVLVRLAPKPTFEQIPLGLPSTSLGEFFEGRVAQSEEPERERIHVVSYEMDATHYQIATLNGLVCQVVINSSIYRSWTFLRTKKVTALLADNREGSSWKFFTDDGFGPSWRRQSDSAWAHYSSTCDILSFATQEYFSLPRI